MRVRGPFDPYGGSTPAVDKLTGEAFEVIKRVSNYLDHIHYLTHNMEAIVVTAQQLYDIPISTEAALQAAASAEAAALSAGEAQSAQQAVEDALLQAEAFVDMAEDAATVAGAAASAAEDWAALAQEAADSAAGVAEAAAEGAVADAITGLVSKSGDTIDGALEITKTGSGDTILRLNGEAGTLRRLDINTAGTRRWSLYGNSVVEAGSSAGSDLVCAAYDDDGNNLGNAFSIDRASRVMTFGAIPNLPGSDPSSDNQAARKAYVDTKVSKTGDTMTGALTLPDADPSSDNHAARKAYVDTKVSKSGDTMTGALMLPDADPSSANQAARKAYVDTKVSKSGDTLTGALTLPDADPSSANHAARKAYVDSAIVSAIQGRQPFYNVKTDFGAAGDGVTDDTTAVQNAIDAAKVTGGVVYFPPGTYKVTRIVWEVETASEAGGRVSLLGAGPGLSVIQGTVGSYTANQAVVHLIADYESEENSLVSGIHISHLRFEHPATVGAAFRADHVAYLYCENCYFIGGGFAFRSAGLVSSSFVNCRFSWAARGVHLEIGTGFSYPNQISFFQCVISNNSARGIHAVSPGGLRVFGGSIEGNGSGQTNDAGVFIDHTPETAGTSMAAAFYGVYFEFNYGRADIYLNHGNELANVNLTVADCSFGVDNTRKTTNRIQINHTVGTGLTASIRGCNFHELNAYEPTTSEKYIAVTGNGTGRRRFSCEGNYYNHPNAVPDFSVYHQVPVSNQNRMIGFSQVTDSNGEVKLTFSPAFKVAPLLFIGVIEGTSAYNYTARVTAIDAEGATIKVTRQADAGGSWEVLSGVTIHVLACGVV